MALQIRKPLTAFSKQPTGKNSGRIKDDDYLDWIRQLPCAVSGRMPVEAAHISVARPEYGKLGRGLGRKESDAWTIPLHSDLHRDQHSMNESKWWASVGLDPCIIAMALRMAYPDTTKALLVLEHSQRQAKQMRTQT